MVENAVTGALIGGKYAITVFCTTTSAAFLIYNCQPENYETVCLPAETCRRSFHKKYLRSKWLMSDVFVRAASSNSVSLSGSFFGLTSTSCICCSWLDLKRVNVFGTDLSADDIQSQVILPETSQDV